MALYTIVFFSFSFPLFIITHIPTNHSFNTKAWYLLATLSFLALIFHFCKTFGYSVYVCSMMVFVFVSDTSGGMKERVCIKLSLNITLLELFLLSLCEYASTFTCWFLYWVLVISHDLWVFLSWVIVELFYFGGNVGGFSVFFAVFWGFH